jgi:hypothetical protein
VDPSVKLPLILTVAALCGCHQPTVAERRAKRVQLTLAWTAVDLNVKPYYALDYKVYQAIGAGNYSLAATRTTTNYTATILAGTAYHYRVTVHNVKGESSPITINVNP